MGHQKHITPFGPSVDLYMTSLPSLLEVVSVDVQNVSEDHSKDKGLMKVGNLKCFRWTSTGVRVLTAVPEKPIPPSSPLFCAPLTASTSSHYVFAILAYDVPSCGVCWCRGVQLGGGGGVVINFDSIPSIAEGTIVSFDTSFSIC